MFGILTCTKTAICKAIFSSYSMLFSRQENTQDIEDKDKVTSVLDYSQIASHIYIATNKTWRSQRQILCHADLEQQLSSTKEAFESLNQEHIKQREQRLRDKAVADQAFEQVLRLESQCKEIQDARQMAEESLQLKINQHQSEIEAKNDELAKLIDEHHLTIDTLEESHAAALDSVTQKAADQQLQMENAHLTEVRALTETSKTNRSAWEKAKQSMRADMKRMDRDFKDTLQANKDEITRVTELSYRLAAENRLLAGVLDQVPAEEIRERANEVFEEVRRTREELEKTRTKLKIGNEKIENILEAMQQERDHWEAHGNEEKKAQAQVYDLGKQIAEIQERIKLRDDLLCAAGLSGRCLTTTTANADAISKIAFENDELRVELQGARDENAKLQSDVNKVDDENCTLCMKLDTTEADLHKAEERLRMLEDKQSLINKEHELLYAAVDKHESLTTEDKQLLQKHLREATAVNEYLRGRNFELRNELTKAREFAEVVEDKCNLEIDKAYKQADFWELLYWDEAVPKVEHLTQEIHELNKELGKENVHVQERLERDVVVADRNALRYACKYSLRGVDTDIIPVEVYEPGFVPGWIPATHDALRTLRPLGWAPVAEFGKVWLAPMYKPFTQEDAAYRLRAQHQTERKEHRTNLNASPPPEADFEAPFNSSNSHSSAGNAYNSATAYGEPQAPPYKSEWMKMRSELTHEAYEDMDTDLKLGVLRMIGVELNQDNDEDEMF